MQFPMRMKVSQKGFTKEERTGRTKFLHCKRSCWSVQLGGLSPESWLRTASPGTGDTGTKPNWGNQPENLSISCDGNLFESGNFPKGSGGNPTASIISNQIKPLSRNKRERSCTGCQFTLKGEFWYLKVINFFRFHEPGNFLIHLFFKIKVLITVPSPIYLLIGIF